MRITILTLFPRMFTSPFAESMIKRAMDRGIIRMDVHNIRDWTLDKHHVVDDSPFGGGPGMVMKPEPLFAAVEAVRSNVPDEPGRAILLTPQGRVFNQSIARELAAERHLILVCGHYEGMDERVHQHLADDEISLGDFVLTGGEPAAICIVDAVVRLIPGVLGDPESGLSDSIAGGLLQYPQYTRPRVFREWEAPDILLSGNHQDVARWRRRQSILRTLKRRPDLLQSAGITQDEIEDALRSVNDVEEKGVRAVRPPKET